VAALRFWVKDLQVLAESEAPRHIHLEAAVAQEVPEALAQAAVVAPADLAQYGNPASQKQLPNR
jgi:hypothetical protein